MIRAFLVDDEELALKRLERLLDETGRVEIIGRTTNPDLAVQTIRVQPPELLFLDIQMPGRTGFQMLELLPVHPWIVFTTAYSEFALQAFETHSLDYLLKPVERSALDRALNKFEQVRTQPLADLQRILTGRAYPKRVASRSGDKIEFLDLDEITHFFAKDKLTFAATGQRERIVDETIAALELRLDPDRFLRIHRSVIVNLSMVKELHLWFGGKMLLRLKDGTELPVARDRVAELKRKLGG